MSETNTTSTPTPIDRLDPDDLTRGFGESPFLLILAAVVVLTPVVLVAMSPAWVSGWVFGEEEDAASEQTAAAEDADPEPPATEAAASDTASAASKQAAGETMADPAQAPVVRRVEEAATPEELPDLNAELGGL